MIKDFYSRIFFYRLANIFLRSTILIARLSLVILIAKLLAVSEVADYGLFTAILGYSLYLVGLDFYVFSSREVIKCGKSHAGDIIKTQLVVNMFIFVLLSISFPAFSSLTNWSKPLVLLFLPILLLEYLNQEIARLLVLLERPLLSTTLTFIRQALWVIVAIPLMYSFPKYATLTTVLCHWLVFSALACAFGIFVIKNFQLGGWSLPLKFNLIRNGLRVSSFMLVGTLALRGVQTLDRVLLEILSNDIFLASYVIAFGIASVLPVFIDSGLVVFSYPAIIKAAQEKKFSDAINLEAKLFVSSLIFTVIFSLIASTGFSFILDFLSNSDYDMAMQIFPYVMFAFAIYSLGISSHYGLYARGFDRIIVFSQLTGLVVFLMVLFFLYEISGPYSVLIALGACFSTITSIKSLFYLSHRQQYNGTI